MTSGARRKRSVSAKPTGPATPEFANRDLEPPAHPAGGFFFPKERGESAVRLRLVSGAAKRLTGSRGPVSNEPSGESLSLVEAEKCRSGATSPWASWPG